MTDKELWDRTEELYGELAFSKLPLDEIKQLIYLRVSKFFSDNPNHKVEISRSQYRRLHDGWPHTWSPCDFIGDVMVHNNMQRYINWTD